MKSSNPEPDLSRLPFGMVVFVAMSIIIALFSISFPIKPVVASPPLDPALEQAVSTAIRNQQPNATTAHIIVSPISRVKAWVFGSAAVIPQPSSNSPTDEETAPQILLFFAEQRGGGWQVALEHTPAFTQALTQIPQHLLTPEQWATMPTTAQLSGDGSMQLNLPWAVGETWYLTGGPHKTFSYETTRSGLDFAVNGGRVRAAQAGVAYTPCGQSSDLVRIDHPGGFSTNYYHLAGITVTNGSWVERYTDLGMIGTGTRCLGGYVTGAHVHFWISRGGTPISIDGIDIGGWTVSALPNEYEGCMTRIRDRYRQCAVGRITNEGNFPPNPPYLISPDDGVTIKTPTVTLQVADAGDPDNWPRPIRNFFFRITKSDNSWSVSSDWTDSTSWTVTLPSEGSYSWIVYAGDWELPSAAAGPRTLTYIPNRPPNPPYLISPDNNAIVKTATVTLQVADAGDPDNWPSPTRNFRFTITKADNSWSASSDWIDNTSWTVTLPSEGSYSWVVYAGDWELPSAAAGPRTLTYIPNRPPNPPNLISPDNNAIVKTATVTLQVADAGEPDNWPNSTRTCRFTITNADNSWSASSDWIACTSWTVTLPAEGRYSWTASVRDGAEQSATANSRTLTYIPNRPPNPPNLISPDNGTTINTATVTLQVTDGGDPDTWPNSTRRFRFIIASSDNSWRAESDWIDGPIWTVQLPSKGEYVWQAQANDGAADSTLSGQRRLYYTIAASVPAPQPPTPAPNVWQVPYFSQLDSRWGTQPINRPAYATYCNNTIGQIGCALTSLTMVARFYGVDHNPGTMNTCLGAYACPLYWGSQQVHTCTNNKMRWVSWPAFSYANLQTELRRGPVILELSTSAGYMHFIVVLGGSGTDPANYIVHDPGVRNGAYTTLANVLRYWRGYQPSSMRIYTGTPAPLPANLAEHASQADQVEPVEPLASPPLLNGATITGTIAPYRNTSTEMVLELAAQSAAGAVTEMRVWTNAEQSTVWQPFSQYVSVPLAETYYVQFRDSQGNTSEVISTGLPQVQNLNIFTTFIPLTTR